MATYVAGPQNKAYKTWFSFWGNDGFHRGLGGSIGVISLFYVSFWIHITCIMLCKAGCQKVRPWFGVELGLERPNFCFRAILSQFWVKFGGRSVLKVRYPRGLRISRDGCKWCFEGIPNLPLGVPNLPGIFFHRICCSTPQILFLVDFFDWLCYKNVYFSF